MRDNYNIACVLKSGGDYDWNYVHNLNRLLKKHCSLPFTLHCLTDLIPPGGFIRGNLKYHVLRHNWPGWWAKIELFRIFISTPVFYFDLDTVIVDNINHIIQYPHKFSALRPLYAEKYPEHKKDPRVRYLYDHAFGSGLMAWDGDCSHIYHKFREDPEDYQRHYKGDQVFIQKMIKLMVVDRLQDLFTKQIVSYKLDIQLSEERREEKEELPKYARIVCFSGRPRPKELTWNGEREWLDWIPRSW